MNFVLLYYMFDWCDLFFLSLCSVSRREGLKKKMISWSAPLIFLPWTLFESVLKSISPVHLPFY